jgi:cytochrome c biogenesis protein CcmG/thiol:disulfide interchange protein DsbE
MPVPAQKIKPAKKPVWRAYLPLIIFFMLVAVLGIGLTLNPRLVPSPLIGKPAPDFSLPLLDGSGVLTQETFKGKVTLLNVWASWCYVCREELPAVKWLSKQGVRIIGFDYKDKPADAKAWLQQFGNPYSEVISDINGRVGINWGVYGAPETFVIDHNGIIREKHVGALDEEYIKQKLGPLLEKLSAEIRGPAT